MAKPMIAEDRRDLVDHLADRMDAAALGRRLPHRQRHVDLFGGQPRGDRGVLQLGLACGERLGDAVLQPVDRRALHLPLLRRSSRPASSAARRPSPSCRARRRARPRSPARRRPRRCRPSGNFRVFPCSLIVPVLGRMSLGVGSKKNPRQPCQRGFPKSEFRMLGKRWLKLQRSQKRSAWCSSDIRARPWPWPPAPRKPAARGSPCRTEPCGRSRCRPCSGRR